jgi:hypothetical protein
MSNLSAWLAGRHPTPPADLVEALAFGGEVDSSVDALVAALSAEGGARLAAARARLGRVRESAFRLLEADALITYACEAALEREDPEAALRQVLSATR